ncbi:hypothetical protein FACS189420_7760 [Bacteroidia bacterium]|nr:hypothetical protein FACS189420_7760 [Bacteroidia bacterium]
MKNLEVMNQTDEVPADYEAPAIEVLEIVVERGFAATPGNPGDPGDPDYPM